MFTDKWNKGFASEEINYILEDYNIQNCSLEMIEKIMDYLNLSDNDEIKPNEVFNTYKKLNQIT